MSGLVQETVRALLVDGSVVSLRELGSSDIPVLVDLHRVVPSEARCTAMSGTAACAPEDFLVRLASDEFPRHLAIVAFRDDPLLGVAHCATAPDSVCAEAALGVAPSTCAPGGGTQLLEHLASIPQHHGVRPFTVDLSIDGITELVDVHAALDSQPLPAGRSVAVLSNAGGLGVLTADACATHGLTMAELSDETTRALREAMPATSSPHNPVDTGAVVDETVFARCLDLIAADPAVDAVIAVTVLNALGDPATAIHRLSGGKPILGVRAGQVMSVETTPTGVPCYNDPTWAAFVLARLVDRAQWLARPEPDHADLDGISLGGARRRG